MTAREQAADVDVAALRGLLDDGRCLCSSAHTDWRGVAALLDRLERAEAAVRTAELAIDAVSKYADAETERANEAERKVARAYALADEWEAEDHPTSTIIARELRAALGGDQ